VRFFAHVFVWVGSEATCSWKKVEVEEIVNLAGVAVVDAQ